MLSDCSWSWWIKGLYSDDLMWYHCSPMSQLISQWRWLMNAWVQTPHWQSAWHCQPTRWPTSSVFAKMWRFWPIGESTTNKPFDHCIQPCHGRCWEESIVNLSTTASFLEKVCGWHTNSSTPRQGPALSPTPELHWAHRAVHCWNGVRRYTAFLGRKDHAPLWWILVEHTHGQVLGLPISSSIDTQGGSGLHPLWPC